MLQVAGDFALERRLSISQGRLERMGTEPLAIAGVIAQWNNAIAGDGIATLRRSLIGARVQTTKRCGHTSHSIALWRRRSCPLSHPPFPLRAERVFPSVSRRSCLSVVPHKGNGWRRAGAQSRATEGTHWGMGGVSTTGLLGDRTRSLPSSFRRQLDFFDLPETREHLL